MANDIKKIKVGGTTYDITAVDSDKLGGKDPSNYVPSTRKINGKALSADITLSAADVGALPNTTPIPTDTNTWRKVQLNGTDKLGTGISTNPLNIKAGDGMTITESGGTFTFAANLSGLSGVMHFLGTTTTAISDGAQIGTIAVDGKNITVDNGDVALYGGYEYVWANGAWEQLGQEGSFSLRGHDHEVSLDKDTFVKSINGGSGSLTSNDTSTDGIAYIASAGHTAASLGTPNTGSAAPGGHKHTYDKATGVTLTANDATATGRITYVQSISGGSATGSGAGSAAPNGHKHSVTAAGTVSLGANTTATDGVKYIEEVTHTAATLTGTTTFIATASYSNGILTLTSGTVGISGGSISKTTKYFHPSFTGTAVTSGANDGNAVSTISGVSYTAPAATTKYLSAAPTTTSTNTGTNDGTNFNAVTGYPNFSGGSGSHTTKYLHHTHLGASVKTDGQAVTGVTVLADE